MKLWALLPVFVLPGVIYAAYQLFPTAERQQIEARESLVRLGIPVTQAAFCGVAERGDLIAAKLFLAAGMNPHEKCSNQLASNAIDKATGEVLHHFVTTGILEQDLKLKQIEREKPCNPKDFCEAVILMNVARVQGCVAQGLSQDTPCAPGETLTPRSWARSPDMDIRIKLALESAKK